MRIAMVSLWLGALFSVAASAYGEETAKTCITISDTHFRKSIPTTTTTLTSTKYKPTISPATITTTVTGGAALTRTVALGEAGMVSPTATITQVRTETTTATLYSVTIETTLAGTATSYIPDAPQFTPLSRQIHNQGYSQRRVAEREAKFAQMVLGYPKAATDDVSDQNQDSEETTHYPALVLCKAAVTETVFSTGMYSEPMTVTATVTPMATVFSPIPTPDNALNGDDTAESTSTITITSASTATVSTVSILTRTTTVAASTRTSYAACKPTNLVSEVNGSPIISVAPLWRRPIISQTYDKTAQSCCEACQRSSSCQVFYFFANSQCFLLTNKNGMGSYELEAGLSYHNSPTIVGNGPGGQFVGSRRY